MRYIFIPLALCLGLPISFFAQATTPPPVLSNTTPTNVAATNMTVSNASATNNLEMEAKRVSNWAETLNFGIASQRLSTVKQIRMLKATNMIPSLQEHFTKENSVVVKEEIIYIFMEATNTDAGFWQKIFTDEKDIVVLQRAAYAIEVLKAPDVGAQIFDKLTNDITNEKSVRFNANAIRALGELKYTAALPVIVDVATNRDLNQDYRGSAVMALGIFKDPGQMELLKTLLTNAIEPRSVRRYAAIGIGRYESPEASEVLAPIATNEMEDQSLRTGAIMGLGYASNEANVAIMEVLSKSDNTTLRVEAVKSLGRMKSEASQEILKYKAFKDPEAIVRREARTALQAMGIDVDALEKEMRNPTPTPAASTNAAPAATNTPPAVNAPPAN